MALLDEDNLAVVAGFRRDVTDFLNKWKSDEERRNWKTGASMSFCATFLRQERGWRNIGNSHDFHCSLRIAGFELVPGLLKNGKEHKSVETVTFTERTHERY